LWHVFSDKPLVLSDRRRAQERFPALPTPWSKDCEVRDRLGLFLSPLRDEVKLATSAWVQAILRPRLLEPPRLQAAATIATATATAVFEAHGVWTSGAGSRQAVAGLEQRGGRGRLRKMAGTQRSNAVAQVLRTQLFPSPCGAFSCSDSDFEHRLSSRLPQSRRWTQERGGGESQFEYGLKI
jgi:hypothetical protein